MCIDFGVGGCHWARQDPPTIRGGYAKYAILAKYWPHGGQFSPITCSSSNTRRRWIDGSGVWMVGGGGGHQVSQRRQRWVKYHPSRSRSTEAGTAPKAVFPATRPAGKPPGPGWGPMQYADAVGGSGGWYCGRYGVDSCSTASPWSSFRRCCFFCVRCGAIMTQNFAIPRLSRHVPRGVTWRDDRGIVTFCVMIGPQRTQKMQHLGF